MSLLAELKRRNVVRVGIAYLAGAWLVVQIAETVLPIFGLPPTLIRPFLIVLVVGFPLVVAFSWAYELTPEGFKKDKDVDRSESVAHVTGRKLDFAIFAMMAIAILYLVLDNYVFEKSSPEFAFTDRSIAVLPFQNLSNVADDANFVDGIRDDILTQLAKLSSLYKVISRTSIERYRDTNLSITQIGEELGVATILEGGVQRAGDRVRVNIQLIDARSDEPLWAETYDRHLTIENLFAIQTEISRAIVVAIHGALSDEDSRQLQTLPTTSLAAYDKFVLGRHEIEKRTGVAILQAQAYFEQAIELDSEYALAYVGLADSLALQSDYAGVPEETNFAQRQLAIDKALSLNPLLGEAYASSALLKRSLGQDDEAEKDHLRAIELSPNYVAAHQWYASYLRKTGRFDEALVHARKTADLDPMSPVGPASVALNLSALGRDAEAKVVLLDGVKRNPDFPPFYAFMADILTNEGRIGEATKWIRVAVRANPTMFGNRLTECNLYLLLADDQSAEDCFDSLEEELPEVAAGSRLFLYWFRADYDDAAILVDTLVQEGANQSKFVLADYLFYVGDWNQARTILEELSPGAFLDEDWAPGPFGLDWAVQVACVLYADGDVDRANYLFNQTLTAMQSLQRMEAAGYGELDVLIHVVRGDKQRAISSLREVVDMGWRRRWWQLRSPVFNSMLDDPDWVSLIDEIEGDIARQRQWYEKHKDEPLF